MKGYKAFNKGLKCKDFQYEIGKEYKTDKLKICESGFHFCKNPLDVLDYYDLCDCEFAEVEAIGKIETKDNKSVTDNIKINAKLELPQFINTSFNFLWEKCKKDKSNKYKDCLASSGDSSQLASSGNYSQLASSGNYSQLASSGDSSQLASSGYSSKLASSGNFSKLASSGDSSQLASSGKDSIVAGIGKYNKAKGIKGNWLVLAEWIYDDKVLRYIPKNVKSVKIDGKKIKENVYYELKDGKLKEVKE